MKFKILVKHIGEDDGQAWEEEYDKNTQDSEKWAEDIIKWFNETLRPGEKPRELVNVIILDNKK